MMDAVRWSMLLLLGSNVPSYLWGEELDLTIDFEQSSPGVYSEAQAEAEWPGFDWSNLDSGRATVELDPDDRTNQVLRVTYPARKIRSKDSGAQFAVTLPEGDAYELAYRLRFDANFEWTRGGKLPGLAGGGTTYTGGKKADGNGWSARYMWRPDAQLVVYLYHLDQERSYGDDLAVPDFEIPRERWFRLRQQIVLNTGSEANGLLKVWIDDTLVLEKTKLRFRKASKGKVDCFYFSTFYGGSSKDYVPEKEHFIWFDDFQIRAINP